ncbi:MAG: Holliday junction branch migration protein RuvA [Ruminococcaceae bacterium]|nr:Holliday junction branch migration protein RuvA [Oscillospiraceae bacterium]
MIYSLNGKLLENEPNTAVIECSGVGYKCSVSLKTSAALPKIGENVFLYTYLAIREDAVDLFGFISKDEMKAFKLITSVNGVGPKVGIAILSEFTPDYLYTYIAAGDYKALTTASGVGPKLAQRIVLELKDKIGTLPKEINVSSAFAVTSTTELPQNNLRSAVAALVSLGFLQVEANRAVQNIDPTLSTEDIIKQALSKLSSGKY